MHCGDSLRAVSRDVAVLAALVAAHVAALGALARHMPRPPTAITPDGGARLCHMPATAPTSRKHSAGVPRLSHLHAAPQPGNPAQGSQRRCPARERAHAELGKADVTPFRRSCCTSAAASTARQCARPGRISCTRPSHPVTGSAAGFVSVLVLKTWYNNNQCKRQIQGG